MASVALGATVVEALHPGACRRRRRRFCLLDGARRMASLVVETERARQALRAR